MNPPVSPFLFSLSPLLHPIYCYLDGMINSNLISKERVSDRCHLGLWLKVNGMERQRTSCSDMIFE